MGERVGGARTGHPERSDLVGVVPGQGSFSGLGLGDRDAPFLGEPRQRVASQRVVDPAAGDNQRLRRAREHLGRAANLGCVGANAADAVHAPGEEGLWIVVGLGLDVLGERQGHRPARRRIDEGFHRRGQARQ